MTKRNKISKAKKITAISLGALLLLIIIAVISLNKYLEYLVEAEINNQINQKAGSLHKIQFEDVNVGIIRGLFSLKNLTVKPIESAIDSIEQAKIKTLVSSRIELFQIKGLKIFTLLINKKIEIKQIRIEGVETNCLINPEVNKSKNKDTLKLSDVFSDKFNGVNIRDIEIKNVSFKLSDYKNINDPLFEIDSASVIGKDIVINEKTLQKPIPVSFSDLDLDVKLFSLKTLKYYDIYSSNLHFNMDDTTLAIDSFRLKPKYSREEYNERIKYENDWFSISTAKVLLKGLNLKKLESDKIFNLSSIEIIKPDIEIYRDKRLPDPPYKYKPLIASIIRKIPFIINIDTLMIKNGELVYQEMQDLTDMPGEVNFDSLYISAYNITNDTQQIKANPVLQVDLSGLLMGEGKLETGLSFYLNRPDDYFTVKGKLDSISGIAFNKMTKNLLLAEIKMGEIFGAEFEFKANDDASDGKMTIFYNNLKVVIYNPKRQNKKLKIMTFIANELVKKKNLSSDPKFRTGTICFERTKNKALPNYLWKSLQTGIVSTVAPIAGKKKQKEIQKKESGQNL